jgi:hypothetical protein
VAANVLQAAHIALHDDKGARTNAEYQDEEDHQDERKHGEA